jgi:DedD protein
MDTPSKERLVGAIIFVVLIVLLVPEILSGPHHLASTTAPGSSPASVARTYIIDLGNPVKPSAVPAGETKPPPLPAPPALAATSTGTALTPAGAPVAAPAAPAPVMDKPATPASAVSGRAPAAVAQTPAATPAPAVTTGPAAATGKEAWGVQLGSFSSAANAERLARTLRGKGYRAFVSPIGTGTHLLHRVRVGPEPTRDAAEGLLARLKRDGQSAAVVTFP